MPLYEYSCSVHGSFDEFRPSSQCKEAIECPECGGPSARVLTVPHTRVLSHATRTGMERNEKSRHEPHVCRSGCGCSSGRQKAKATSDSKSEKKGSNLTSYTGPRPWVIEHA